MKSRNKLKTKKSIKWLFLSYFMLFLLIFLALLWSYRILFMDVVYKQTRMATVEKAYQTVSNVTGDRYVSADDFALLVDRTADECGVSLIFADEDGNILYSHRTDNNDIVFTYTPTQLKEIIIMAENQGGTYVKEFEEQDSGMRKPMKQVIFARKALYTDEIAGAYFGGKQDIYVMISGRVLPVPATVSMWNIQIVCVSVMMTLISVLAALFIARKVSEPIIDMKEKSLKFANGDYGVRFDEGGYLEVSELGKSLNYAVTELGKTEQLRQDLIANVSHDLRTPLTMIIGYAEMIRDLPGEDTGENMNIIIDEAQHLSELVSDMLDMSKLQAGVVGFEMERVDLNELLESICNRYNKMYERDGYKVALDCDGKYTADCDRIRVTQVIYNLINNAINHIGADNTVYVRCRREGDSVRVHVVDRGDGIEESMLSDIWNRYYKGSREHKRAHAGSGLGLSIVKTILDRAGRNYGVTSKVGEGSDFYFDLKLYSVKEGPDI